MCQQNPVSRYLNPVSRCPAFNTWFATHTRNMDGHFRGIHECGERPSRGVQKHDHRVLCVRVALPLWRQQTRLDLVKEKKKLLLIIAWL